MKELTIKRLILFLIRSHQKSQTKFQTKMILTFHTTAIVKLLGMRKSLNAAQNIMSAEIKRILNYSSTR